MDSNNLQNHHLRVIQKIITTQTNISVLIILYLVEDSDLDRGYFNKRNKDFLKNLDDPS